jgi:hypothetical protein
MRVSLVCFGYQILDSKCGKPKGKPMLDINKNAMVKIVARKMYKTPHFNVSFFLMFNINTKAWHFKAILQF